MQITLSFETPISDADASVLQALVATGTVPGAHPGPAPAAAAKEEAKPAAKAAAPAAKKAAAAPAKAPEPEPAKEEKSPLEEAIARATALVGEGKHLLVKKALGEVSVARVSQLQEGDVEAFMAALDEG